MKEREINVYLETTPLHWSAPPVKGILYIKIIIII